MSQPFAGKKIAIINHNRDGADSLAMVLQLQGADARAYRDKSDLIAGLAESRPDVLIADSFAGIKDVAIPEGVPVVHYTGHIPRANVRGEGTVHPETKRQMEEVHLVVQGDNGSPQEGKVWVNAEHDDVVIGNTDLHTLTHVVEVLANSRGPAVPAIV